MATPGPELSSIDSQTKVDDLVQRGALEKVYLLPPEFGGDDRAENCVYVPVGLAEAKYTCDRAMLRGMLAQGGGANYRAMPRYEGASMIPIAILVQVVGKTTAASTIGVWGAGLTIEETPSKPAGLMSRLRGLFGRGG